MGRRPLWQDTGDMVAHKKSKDWKIIKGLIAECIEIGCTAKPNSEGLCWEHYDKERQDEIVENDNDEYET